MWFKMKKLFVALLICLMLSGVAFAIPPSPPQPAGSGSGDFLANGTVPMTAAIIPNAANTLALGSATAEWADLYLGDGAIIYGQNDQSNTITSSATGWAFAGAVSANNVNPDAADGATLGTTALEWSDIYLADGAVIYGQNDQGNTITSSATGWTFNLAVTAPSFTSSKSSGIAGSSTRYEANSTDTDYVGEIGPASMTANTSYLLRDAAAVPSSANMVLVADGSAAASGAGTPADPWIYTRTWVDLDSYALLSGATFGGIVLGDSTPDADGEIGYASNAYSFFANSEDMTWTASANKWTLSSATGVTEVNLSALNLVTTGQITGRIVVVSDADGKTLSGTDIYGSMQLATGAGTWVIPDVDAAAETGQSFCIYATAASEIVIDGNAEDKIRLGGTLGAAGGDITNNTAEAAGDFICLVLTDFATDVAHWTVLGKSGTWTVVP